MWFLTRIQMLSMNTNKESDEAQSLINSNGNTAWDPSLWEKHAQLPAVDMLKVQGSLWCYSNLSPTLIQPNLGEQSLCTLHSDCAKKSTYANMWSLDGSSAGAC